MWGMKTMSIQNNPEFKAYKDELESRSKYTFLSDDEIDRFYEMSIKPQQFSLEKAKQHPFLWAYHVIGFKPRDYQFKMLDDMHKYRRIASVTSRQIGKSSMVALFAFWAAYNNVYPSGPKKDTKIMIVSQTEKAAKDLLKTIDGFITMADERMAIYTQNYAFYQTDYFRSRIKNSTQFEIHFARGSIKVYPPTASVRGNSIDVLVIDEAAWLNNTDPDYFFASDALPTTTATNGKTFLFSTPKGNSGFFYDVIRPMNEQPLQGWRRIWFPWTIVKDEKILENIWQTREAYISKGDELDFKIEYEASFLSGKHSFFAPHIIDQCVYQHLQEELSHKGAVIAGIDYGDTHSRTVVVLVHYDPKNDKITLLTYKEFDQGFNNADLPDYIDHLVKSGRYNIDRLVVDDCVGGKTANEHLRRRGYKIDFFQFSSSKHEFYEYLKVAFSKNQIMLYNDPNLLNQLKSLESYETQGGRTQIKKPNGGRDDLADAFMLACSPFIKPRRARGWRVAQ